jgi:hypothetical protein
MAWDDYEDYGYGNDIWGSNARRTSPNWNFTGTDEWSPTNRTPAQQTEQKPDWLNSLGQFGLGTGLDLGVNQAKPEDVMPRRNVRGQPTYDFGPMQRYQEYLATEPDRAAYQPKGLDRIINAASAGLQGYRTGNVAEGLKVGEYMRERPYQEALKQWQGKGGRYEAEARMADTRYKTQDAAYQRDVTNARDEERLSMERQRLQIALADARDKGYQFRPGDNGKMVAFRIKDGKEEVLPMTISNTEYTLAQQDTQREERRQDALTQHSTPSGSSLLAAATSRQNAAMRDATTRGAYSYTHGSGNEPIDPKLPGDTNTPAKLLSAYGEFNDPKMLSVSGGRARFQPQFLKDMEDPTRGPDGKTKGEKFFQEKAARTGVPYDRLVERWKEFKMRINPMLLPDEEED